VAPVSLLPGFLPDADLARYLTRQNGSPEPGMRRVMETARGYACWLYEDDAWSQRAFVWDRLDSVRPGLDSGPPGQADDPARTVSRPGRLAGQDG